MKVILCGDCGNVIKKYAYKCARCRSNNLTWYRPEDPELKNRISQITGKRHPSEPIVSMLIVALITTAICGAVYGYQELFDEKSAHALAGLSKGIPQ